MPTHVRSSIHVYTSKMSRCMVYKGFLLSPRYL